MDRKSLVKLRRLAMKYASLSAFALIALTSAAAAQAVTEATSSSHVIAQWAFTVLGVAMAGRMAWQAFGRSPVPVADVPTFPRYMTSRGQYQLGSWTFAALASLFFFLLVFEHRQVFELASVLSSYLPDGILKTLLDAAAKDTASQLVVIAAVGGIYLFVLSKEGPWNVVLMMRDAIYRCISIPQLASRIVDQIRFSLKVPAAARSAVIAGTPGLVEQDFQKAPNTPDRRWAETCYMKWWLVQGQDAGDDATFFAEQSFGFDALLSELQDVSRAMSTWKSGGVADISLPDLFVKVNNLHNRFSRLLACYLIYRNSSRKALAAEALQFGISINFQRLENPLKYWIIYLLVLLGAVYVGVYVSAVGYDLAADHVLNAGQDITRTFQWMLYSTSNYGFAIIVVLLLRMAGSHFGNGLSLSPLITYCWTFVVAFLAGPLGLTLALHFFGPDALQKMDLWPLFVRNMRWGMGPAFVCIYISYYLDRQSCVDMPSIDHSAATIGWRLLNAFAFAGAIVLLLLPALMSIGQIPVADDPWTAAKLRTVATGTLFAMTFALALAAQFAVRDQSERPAAGGGARTSALPAATA